MVLNLKIPACHSLRKASLTTALCGMLFFWSQAADPRTDIVYDPDAAREICDILPLDPVEGIWAYPEDNVTVLIRRKESLVPSSLPEYSMHVVETSDTRLKPGEEIGILKASPDAGKFDIQLFTEKKNGLLLKPVTCMARIDKNGEAMTFRQTGKKFRFRLTFNPSLILPKFWRVVRLNSGTNNDRDETPPSGMVKIYPSYDGNGSSRRQPRYL